MSYLPLKNVKSSELIGQLSFLEFRRSPYFKRAFEGGPGKHREKIRGSADIPIANESAIDLKRRASQGCKSNRVGEELAPCRKKPKHLERRQKTSAQSALAHHDAIMRSTLFQTPHRNAKRTNDSGIVMFLVGLTSLVSLASCAKSNPPPRSAASSSAPVTLELEKGPAPALPNPMLVTDSVHGGVFESCYQGFHPTGNAENDLAQMTSLCGPPNSMKPVTGVIRGSQAHQEAIARFTFRGEMGRCYRIFSASDRGVADMDMAMLDPDKNVVGHDTNEDAFPMLNPDGPFCLTRPGVYTVLVSVEKGAGTYALQVWGF